MKPAWDKLMKHFKGNEHGLVADVDCTAAGKSLCSRVGVRGYPTIKWGDPNALEDYQGGRDFNALKKFAEENLKPICSIANMELCSEDDKQKLEDLMKMPIEELKKQIEGKEQEIKDAEKYFEDETQKLQDAFSQLKQNKEDTIQEVKNSGLGKVKSVFAWKMKSTEEKSEL